MKHSWTDLFSSNGDYLVYLLPLELTDHLTFARFGSSDFSGAIEELEKWGSELTTIEVCLKYCAMPFLVLVLKIPPFSL